MKIKEGSLLSPKYLSKSSKAKSSMILEKAGTLFFCTSILSFYQLKALLKSNVVNEENLFVIDSRGVFESSCKCIEFLTDHSNNMRINFFSDVGDALVCIESLNMNFNVYTPSLNGKKIIRLIKERKVVSVNLIEDGLANYISELNIFSTHQRGGIDGVAKKIKYLAGWLNLPFWKFNKLYCITNKVKPRRGFERSVIKGLVDTMQISNDYKIEAGSAVFVSQTAAWSDGEKWKKSFKKDIARFASIDRKLYIKLHPKSYLSDEHSLVKNILSEYNIQILPKNFILETQENVKKKVVVVSNFSSVLIYYSLIGGVSISYVDKSFSDGGDKREAVRGVLGNFPVLFN